MELKLRMMEMPMVFPALQMKMGPASSAQPLDLTRLQEARITDNEEEGLVRAFKSSSLMLANAIEKTWLTKCKVFQVLMTHTRLITTDIL
jgi:hypothetical protein